jgi:hypothetical protein
MMLETGGKSRSRALVSLIQKLKKWVWHLRKASVGAVDDFDSFRVCYSNLIGCYANDGT